MGRWNNDLSPIIPLFHHSICLCYLDPQDEQLLDEQVPQEEPAVLVNFPPTEKAKADIILPTFLLSHFGQVIS